LNYKKKSLLIFYLVTVIAVILICLVFVEVAAYLALQKIEKTKVAPRFVDFYQKYSYQVNHLRDPELSMKFPEMFDVPESLIYTKVGNGTRVILLQGDSWAEQVLFLERSTNELKKFVQAQYTFINAGTSSYSASPMTAQLNILRRDFRIFPEQIITIFDQTDIGDELCRYRNLRENISGNIYVRSFPMGSHELYAMEHFIKSDSARRSFNLNSVRLAKLSYYGYQLEHYRKQNPIRCGWRAISSYLEKGVSDEEGQYIVSVFSDYINTVFDSNKTKKLILVSHPHRFHLEKKYKMEISVLIKSAIKQSKYSSQIIYLDFNNSINGGTNPLFLNKIYREGDLASHLSSDYYQNIFFRKILAQID